MFSGPWVWKDLNKDKTRQTFEKIARFVKKLLKFVMLKCWNHSITTRNNAVTYYQTLEEVLWHLGLIKIKNVKNFQKAWKKLQKKYKFAFLASGCSSVSSHGDGGCTGGQIGGHNWGGGGQQRGWGGHQWGCLQPLRTALHTISISLQNSLSWDRAERL